MPVAAATVKVFVSYAREDDAVTRRLAAALAERGVEATGDWQLVRGDDYLAQLRTLIAACDAVVFLLSPDSVRSGPCRDELDHAARQGKRIIPVAIRDHGADGDLPPQVSAPQWTFMRTEAEFAGSLEALVAAVRTDFALAREHARLLVAAELWQGHQRRSGYLLRGEALQSAEHWLARVGARAGMLPTATTLQADFILQSQRHRRRTSGRLVAAVSAVAIALAALALLAYTRQKDAEAQARIAKARQLGAQAASLTGTQPDLALLLAAASWKTDTRGDGRAALLQAVQAAPQLASFLHGAAAPVRAVAVSPGGEHIVLGDESGVVRWFDAATAQPLGEARPHQDAVHALAFSPDGRRLAIGFWKGQIAVFDAASRTLQDGYQAASAVLALDFAPAGDRIAVGLISGDIGLLDLRDRMLRGLVPQAHGSGTWSLRFWGDDRILSGGWDGTIAAWNAASGGGIGARLKGHGLGVRGLSLSPDGRSLASGSLDGTVRLWDLERWQARGDALAGHDGYVETVAFSPDGRLLASAASDATVRLWHAADGQPAGRPLLGHQGGVWSVAFSRSGTGLVSGGADRKAILWDLTVRHPLARALQGPAERGIGQLAFSPDGRWLAGAGIGGQVLLWRCTPACEAPRILRGHAQGVWRVAFDPASKVLASAGTDRTVRLWSVATGEALGAPLRGPEGDVYGLAFTPDGRRLVASDAYGSLHVFDLKDRSAARLATGRRTGTGALALGADGTVLALAGDGELIRVDMAARSLLPAIGTPGSAIRAVALAGDGHRLVWGGTDKVIRVAGLHAGQPEGGGLQGHKGAIEGLAADRAGALLASGSDERELLLWDLAARRPLGPVMTGHTSTVGALAFDPTRPRLVTADWDGVVLEWDLDWDHWVRVACRMAGRPLSDQERALYLDGDTGAQPCDTVQPLHGWAPSSMPRVVELADRPRASARNEVVIQLIDLLRAQTAGAGTTAAPARAASAPMPDKGAERP